MTGCIGWRDSCATRSTASIPPISAPAPGWGPAFGGLHIFTGFASGAAYSAGAFPKAFAQYILGAGKPTLPIVSAWFAASTDTSEGTAAAMGPVGAGGVTDLVDFYIGKGPLGPTILPASVKGWWYLHQ